MNVRTFVAVGASTLLALPALALDKPSRDPIAEKAERGPVARQDTNRPHPDERVRPEKPRADKPHREVEKPAVEKAAREVEKPQREAVHKESREAAERLRGDAVRAENRGDMGRAAEAREAASRAEKANPDNARQIERDYNKGIKPEATPSPKP